VLFGGLAQDGTAVKNEALGMASNKWEKGRIGKAHAKPESDDASSTEKA